MALGVVTYGAYQLVNLLRGRTADVGHRNALALIKLERRLAIDVEQRVQRAFLARPAVLACCNVVYLANQVVATPAAMWALHRLSPAVYVPASRRIVLAMFGGTLWHAIQPVAPPRSLGIGITDTVSRHTPLDLESRLARFLFNPTAAMPSMHVAASVLTGRAMWELGRGWYVKAAAVIYPGIVAVAVVATGNHFVLDILGGLAVTAVALAICPGPAEQTTPVRAVQP